MSSAKITTVGFYQYMNAYNNDLFGLLNLPPGIDKDTLINNILLRGGEFEVVYPDPYFYKSAIGLWSNKHYRTFEKWINALNIDYNPLENYDRMEDWTDENIRLNTGTVQDDNTINNNTINSGTQSINANGHDSFSGSGSNTSIDTVSAYDSNSFENDKKNDVSTSNETNSNTTTENIRTDNLNESKTGLSHNTRTDNLKESYTSTRHSRLHGNIGVTTSQQMLQSELDIAKWNIYEQITDLFLSEFCIMVYV